MAANMINILVYINNNKPVMWYDRPVYAVTYYNR